MSTIFVQNFCSEPTRKEISRFRLNQNIILAKELGLSYFFLKLDRGKSDVFTLMGSIEGT